MLDDFHRYPLILKAYRGIIVFLLFLSKKSFNATLEVYHSVTIVWSSTPEFLLVLDLSPYIP